MLEKSFSGFLALFQILKVDFVQSEKAQIAPIFCYIYNRLYRHKLPRPVQPASEALPPALYAALVAKRPRGRPKADATKVFTAIRLDADLLQAFKATGKGWQTRVNAALRQYIAEHPIG